MTKQKFARWSFVFAGVLFLLAAIAPLVSGGTLNPALFVLAMAFLVIGGAIARKGSPKPPASE